MRAARKGAHVGNTFLLKLHFLYFLELWVRLQSGATCHRCGNRICIHSSGDVRLGLRYVKEFQRVSDRLTNRSNKDLVRCVAEILVNSIENLLGRQ